MSSFDPKSLVRAVKSLLEMNQYEVREDFTVHGAQVDLFAKSKRDPFARNMYFEITIEYVNTIKFGKDTTKFLLLRQKDPSCALICISSEGFTADVMERATEAGVIAQTYDDFFRSFEAFSPYVDHCLKDEDLRTFEGTYEEPFFDDVHGEHRATGWLTNWSSDAAPSGRWLIVLGEYGTGKTSLTRVLQRRWIEEYRQDPEKPIPLRIELRAFARQFDARTLLHHFLDNNQLGHLSVDFLIHLISKGRVVLILDGYDEMAQFLNVRERRACLAALATLAKGGARGILTSRPNYFSETEELRVFEALYDSISRNSFALGRDERAYLQQEKDVDALVETYVLQRFERVLRDLTPDQTEALIRRKLAHDPDGQDVLLSLLRRVFRDEAGQKRSLSGKPVIIAYLLELVDDIRAPIVEGGTKIGIAAPASAGELTEWDIYKIIVDRLMLRDQQRSPLDPQRRRRALRALAIELSKKDKPSATAETFLDIINLEFQNELKLMDTFDRNQKREELFEDIRTSATLTRTEGGGHSGWVFSHNSLREYLVVEHLLEKLLTRSADDPQVPISEAMAAFASAVPRGQSERMLESLRDQWHSRRERPGLGKYISLFWRLIGFSAGDDIFHLRSVVGTRSGMLCLDDVKLSRLSFASWKQNNVRLSVSGTRSELIEVNFHDYDLRGSEFQDCLFEQVNLSGAEISGVDFRNTFFMDVNLLDARVEQANFCGLDPASTVYIQKSPYAEKYLGYRVPISGRLLIGYLKYLGAITDDVEDYWIYCHHPRYLIVEKICAKLLESSNSQPRGLTQRGEANVDPPFARHFVEFLQKERYISSNPYGLLSATSEGRQVFGRLTASQEMSSSIARFLRDNRIG